MNMRKRVGALIIMLVMVHISYAEISIHNSPVCKDLMAGKNIDAGNVCVEVMDDMLLVVYTTTGGWELTGTHFWVGASLADMPRTKKGNPKVGHFPYHSNDITGQVRYQVYIPLSDLAEGSYYTALCNQTFLAAAHADLRIEDGSGGYQTESGWAEGDPIASQGNWAMYFEFKFVCSEIPPQIECETAFTYGDKALWDIMGPGGDPITDSWGWQNTVYPGDRFIQPVYAGATQNDINNGTQVGFVYIGYSGSKIAVEYFTVPPYFMSETHLYVGTEETPTADPVLFGNSHYLSGNDRSDVYLIPISGDQLYVVAHAVVCQPVNGSSLFRQSTPHHPQHQ
jgi:uncharacterized RmlC-like cupin family protein